MKLVKTRICRKLVLAFFSLHTLCSCGGGSGGGTTAAANTPNTPAAAAARVVQSAVSSLNTGLTQSVNQNFATLPARVLDSATERQIATEVSVTCLLVGLVIMAMTVVYLFVPARTTDRIDTPTFNAAGTLLLQACNFISGQLAMSLVGAVVGTLLTYNVFLNGTVTDDTSDTPCSVTLNDVEINGQTDYDSQQSSSMITGTATSTCGTDTASCTWSNVDTANEAALAAGCSAS